MNNSSVTQQVALRRQLPSPDECRRIRVSAGVSLREMARQLRVSDTAVLQWETGRTKPNAPHLRAYVSLLAELRGMLNDGPPAT